MAGVWPNTLPQNFVVEGFGMSRIDNAVRFQPEVGPPMARRRGTGGPFQVAGDILLTGAQWLILDDFYFNTLKETDIFTWADPITGVAGTFKFTAPPVIRQVIPGNVVPGQANSVLASLALLELQ